MMNDQNLISSNPIGNTDKKVLEERSNGLSQMDRRRFLRLTGATFGAIAFGGMMGALSNEAYAKAVAKGNVKPMVMPAPLVPPFPINTWRYVNQLIIPPVYVPDSSGIYHVTMSRAIQQILPTGFGLGQTTVYAYGGKAKDRNGVVAQYLGAPGASFEAVRGTPLRVQWTNNLTGSHWLPIDPLLHWANPIPIIPPPPSPPNPLGPYLDEYPWYSLAQTPIPAVVHLHGSESPSQFDGGPDTWFTSGLQYKGPQFSTTDYTYPNSQMSTMLFYHDHALGITRLNVYMGLAGLYFIRDPCCDYMNAVVPPLKYEIPLAIQDRAFFQQVGGMNELAYPFIGNIPTMHPYWNPEFFGEMLGYPAPGSPSTAVILVNGKAWPNLNVDRGQYRLRIVNASSSRFYHLYFSNGMSFVQIGADGGYIRAPVTLNSNPIWNTDPNWNPVINPGALVLAPAERADILVDFSKIAPGTKIQLLNNAPAPFPGGDIPDPQTSGSIMQFTVGTAPGFTPRMLPRILTPTLATYPIPAGTTSRLLTLMEQLQPSGLYTGEPRALFLNGQMWDAAISELPKLGSTEDWYFINLTGDNHPMHLHLVQYQLISRRPFNAAQYEFDWMVHNAPGLVHPAPDNGLLPLNMNWPTQNLPLEPYYTGPARGPEANETGWKDTIKAWPEEVTRIRARFKSQDGKPFPFDATAGPGYVWHCHIIEHEDNEMMRPFKVVK